MLHQALHLTSHIQRAIVTPSNVQGGLADVIAKDEVRVARLVVHDDGEHAA